MKKTYALIIVLLLFIIGCSAAHASPLQVTVSILPQEYFVKKIGGDLVEVNVMVRPGSSPTTYEPQPRQMAQLSKADLYYAIGVPFESAWLPRFKSANSQLDIVNLGDSVVKSPMENHIHIHDRRLEFREHGPDHGDNFISDPHIWLAPQLVRILSQEIRDTLIEHDPDNSDTYRSNYLKFAEEINRLDTELIKLFSQLKGKRNFMVYHPSWGYFAQAYALNQIPIEIEGKEPSPKELAKLIDFAKQKSVKAIFIQPQFSQKSAQAIADSIDANILIADPLSKDWETNLRLTAKAFMKDAR